MNISSEGLFLLNELLQIAKSHPHPDPPPSKGEGVNGVFPRENRQFPLPALAGEGLDGGGKNPILQEFSYYFDVPFPVFSPDFFLAGGALTAGVFFAFPAVAAASRAVVIAWRQ